MDRLRRSLRSFRRRGDNGTLSERHTSGAGGSHSTSDDGSKPPVWSQDEASVRAGTCSFKVKYLGSVEVYESRGMQVCEEALKVLRSNRRRPIKGILYISGDSLRVVDKDSKGLVVDQTIEKVSFCAPDRQHEKGFAYICRDGTTRRWLCYGFHARKNTGERLSHAVGCAFAVCLEKKQKRDREAQRSFSTQNQLPSISESASEHLKLGTSVETRQMGIEKGQNNAFQRNSYRYASLQERLQDPQNVKPAEKPPVKPATNPHAVARPRGNKELFERQGSLRLSNEQEKVAGAVPPIKNGAPDDARFRRFNSLRLNQLPSNLARYEESSQSFGRTGIAEEDSSPNSPVVNSKPDLVRGHQTNPSYVSPPVSELSSPSSGTWASSNFEVTNTSLNETVSPQRIGSFNRSRGDEWLQTTTTQVKYWQQVRGVSPPAGATNSHGTSPSHVTPERHQPPPSFPPPPLPPTVALTVKTNVEKISKQDHGISPKTQSQVPGSKSQDHVTPGKSQGSHVTGWTTFDDKWNSMESPTKHSHSSTYPPLSPTNPFSQESSAVKI